jgi:type I site-specific restriction endonuclease
MINTIDYSSYLEENSQVLEKIKKMDLFTYERLDDVLQVMEFIMTRVNNYSKVEEEFEVIFEVGFTFIYDQLESIKTIYEHYFNKDDDSFKKYDHLMNYYLYLEDLVENLKEKSLYKLKTKKAIEDILSRIEEILKNKVDFTDQVFDEFNLIIEEFVPVGTLSTAEIYALILEEITIK